MSMRRELELDQGLQIDVATIVYREGNGIRIRKWDRARPAASGKHSRYQHVELHAGCRLDEATRTACNRRENTLGNQLSNCEQAFGPNEKIDISRRLRVPMRVHRHPTDNRIIDLALIEKLHEVSHGTMYLV